MPTRRLFIWLLIPLLGVLLAWRVVPPFPEVPNRTFDVGEYLKFEVHYGFINAGYAALEVKKEPIQYQGHDCYHIVGRGWTNGTWDHIYRVRDTYETYMDRTHLIPWQFRRHIVEGNFNSLQRVYFDHQKQQATFVDHSEDRTRHAVPADIQDVISAFYFARARYDHRQLQVGDRISLKNFLDRKTFNLEARMLAREEVKIKGKRYRALKFELLIEEAGLMTDGSEIQFWISDDLNKVPLRIESKLMIGSLKADLIEWDNLRHEFAALME
jgi:hypothetical protein